MKKINWPLNDEVIDVERLISALKDAFLQGATWKRKNETKNIKWRGPKQGKFSAATSPNYDVWLKAENLSYSLENQGHDFLEEIFCIALQLGIEQGRRITVKDRMDNIQYKLIQLKLEEAFKDLENLQESY